MLGGKDAAQVFANLIKIQNAKKGFEIGVFTGYTTLTMAQALEDGGKIIAYDTSEKFTNLGKKYWEKAKVSDKIDLIIGEAVTGLDKLLEDESNNNSYDFAFVDADKVNYDNYYEKLIKLLKKGGWIAFDNCFAGGGVINKNSEDSFT